MPPSPPASNRRPLPLWLPPKHKLVRRRPGRIAAAAAARAPPGPTPSAARRVAQGRRAVCSGAARRPPPGGSGSGGSAGGRERPPGRRRRRRRSRGQAGVAGATARRRRRLGRVALRGPQPAGGALSPLLGSQRGNAYTATSALARRAIMRPLLSSRSDLRRSMNQGARPRARGRLEAGGGAIGKGAGMDLAALHAGAEEGMGCDEACETRAEAPWTPPVAAAPGRPYEPGRGLWSSNRGVPPQLARICSGALSLIVTSLWTPAGHVNAGGARCARGARRAPLAAAAQAIACRDAQTRAQCSRRAPAPLQLGVSWAVSGR